MSDAPLTLKAFFCDDVEKQAAEQLELSACVKTIETAGKTPRAVMPALLSSLKGAVDDILKVELGDVFQNSWGKVAAVRDAMKATAGQPGASAVVPLADHKVSSKHKPSIELFIGPKRLCELEFEIQMTLRVKDASVSVEEGRVAGVHTGVVIGEGDLKYLGQSIAKSATREFKLPGRLRFTRPKTP